MSTLLRLSLIINNCLKRSLKAWNTKPSSPAAPGISPLGRIAGLGYLLSVDIIKTSKSRTGPWNSYMLLPLVKLGSQEWCETQEVQSSASLKRNATKRPLFIPLWEGILASQPLASDALLPRLKCYSNWSILTLRYVVNSCNSFEFIHDICRVQSL